MIHDPLCPWFESTEFDTVISCDDCDLIASVRVDERKRAHLVVDGFDMFSDDRDAMHAWINGTPPNWWVDKP